MTDVNPPYRGGRPRAHVPPEVAAPLQVAGRLLADAITDVDEAVEKLDAAIREAHTRGIPVQRIAEVAGTNRKQVYRSLERMGLFTPNPNNTSTDPQAAVPNETE